MTPSRPARLVSVTCTDVGRVRARNEDVAHTDPEGRFFIVADGMGGQAAGDVAARLAVDTVRDTLDAARRQIATFGASPGEHGRTMLGGLLAAAVRAAHDAVRERARREPDKYGMGTTLEVLVIAGDEAFLAHAGDSRAYLVRGGHATRLTRDHTMAGAMVAAGAITDSDAARSPLSTVLVNAVGIGDDVMVDIIHRELHTGDRLLLCSDGLSDHFDDEELGTQLATGASEADLHALVSQARERGGHDDITGIVVDVLPARQVDTLQCAVPPPPTDPYEVVSWYVDRSLREESGPIRH